jgi:AraC-like DNA-binding protein
MAIQENMKKTAIRNWDGQKVHRSPDGIEFYNYPSSLARKYWYHVLCLGQARLSPGYRSRSTPTEGFLLHYVRRGGMWYDTDGRKCEAAAGSACLMDYSDECEYGNARPRQAEVWWVLFDGRDLPHLLTELRADRDPVFPLENLRRFEMLFLELLALTRDQPRAHEARSFATLAALLAELFYVRAEEYPASLVGRKTVLSKPVRQGIDYMTRFHSNAALGLKMVSHASGLSLRHFMRLFNHELGMTPLQYLSRYRVEHAKQLLGSSDKTMDQIARIVGFSNQNYFSYLFRKLVGKTPREYRAKTIRRT